MDWDDPTRSVIPTLDGAVLAVLAGTREGLTGREVHRRSRRGSQPAVQAALTRLEEQGVVVVERAGSSNVYVLNREHLAARVAEALAGLRSEFFRRLRSQVESWPVAPEAVSVFGSVARGEATTESDVDILVVIASEDDPAWDAQINDLATSVEAWTGNRASILRATLADLARLVQDERPVLGSLQADAIDVVGSIRDQLAHLGAAS